MRVFHFGDSGRRLVGTLHTPARPRPRSAGVLLCNPFGEEASRTHRTYRVLATTIERAGYPAMRFDYSGTGDSSGEAEDATIGAWVADVASASAELQSTSATCRVVATGVRLGATLAALATSRTGVRLRHLILWDPVVDGRAYLGELAANHRNYMRTEAERWQDSLQISEEGFPVEALGTPISPVLARQLATIDLSTEPVEADHVTVVVTTPVTPALERFIARLPPGPATKVISVTLGEAWTSDAALNASIVPMDVIRTLVARLEEVSP